MFSIVVVFITAVKIHDAFLHKRLLTDSFVQKSIIMRFNASEIA